MGGISLATAASVGMTAMNLMNNASADKQRMKYMEANRQASAQKRKNLLETQLANRRAGLGAIGITSSKSAAAVEQRMAKEAYEDIAENNFKYQQEYENLRRSGNRNLLSSVISTTGKIIK